MLVSGRVIAFLFVFGAKIVDFFATLMMRSLFYSLKKTDKNAPSEAAKKNPMGLATPMACPSVRTPDSSSSENKSPANCHWLDRSKLLIMAWIFGTFFGGHLGWIRLKFPSRSENSEVRLEFFLIVLYCMNILNVSKHMQARLPTKTVEYQRLSKIVFCRKV